ncbi:MAG: hypothetical protein Q4E55_03490 [Bacteroidales bacterium]|nr:hypothetical protein [Bacteroidales bacterium]
MAYILDDLKQALEAFESSVRKDVAEIRKQKSEVRRLREEIHHTVSGVKYVRDDQCLILSAPTVIIGNVNRSGELMGEHGGGGTVVIRGNRVSLEGTGSPDIGGSIVSRAASIRHIAVDPGTDGMENVVCMNSEIVNQARAITLQSNDTTGAFVAEAGSCSTGIDIHADSYVAISATPSNKLQTAAIDERVKDLEKYSGDIAKLAANAKKTVLKNLDDIEKLIKSQDTLNDTEEHLRANQPELSDLADKFQDLERMLYSSLTDYIRLLSSEAELNRKAQALKDTKEELGKASADFDKNTTSSHIALRSEFVSMVSTDGDGNLRQNAEAGLYVQMPHIDVVAHDTKGALMADSTLNVNLQEVNLSTASAQLDEKGEKGDIPALGNVVITSKNVTIQAIDEELKDKKRQEKALTKDGTLLVRAEKMKIEATDTEGMATGELTLNAKNIQVAAMDVDKEKRTDKALAASSQMVLVAEKLLAGSKDKKTKGKLVQIAAEQVGIMGNTTTELQQGEGKAVITLEGGNLTAGGGKNALKGDTTIEGKTDIKGDTTAPKGVFKNLEASSSFKSQNITDGVAVPAASTPGKASAKMKEEEVGK